MGMPGRPKGATTKPQFHSYTTDEDRKSFVAWVKKNYKKNPKLATWYGDQMFGKAMQPLGNSDGSALVIQFDPIFKGEINESSQ